MALAVGPLIDKLLQRVRDPQGALHSRDIVRTILQDCQRILNARYGWVLRSDSLSITPHKLVYAIPGSLSSAMLVRRVEFNNADLSFMTWKRLADTDRAWFRKVSAIPKAWSLIGDGLLVIYPGVFSTETVTVTSSSLTSAFANDAATTEIPDDRVSMMLDLAEAVLLVKGRDAAPAKELVERLGLMMQLEEVPV